MPPDVEVLIGHGDGGDHFFSKGIGGQKFEVWAGGENEAVAPLIHGVAFPLAEHH